MNRLAIPVIIAIAIVVVGVLFWIRPTSGLETDYFKRVSQVR